MSDTTSAADDTDPDTVSVTVTPDVLPTFDFEYEVEEDETPEEAKERALELAKHDASLALSETAHEYEWEERNKSPLDEIDQDYGWAVYNTHKDCFVTELGGVTDREVFSSPEEVIEFFTGEDIWTDNRDHLRIVRIILDNEVDRQAIEAYKEQAESDE